MLNLKKAAFGAVTVALMCGAMAGAQQTGGRVPQPSPKVSGGGAVQVANIDQVGAVLRGAGYQVKTVTRPGGQMVHELDIYFEGRIVPVDVSLSPDGTKVWLTITLSVVPQGTSIPPHIMKQMLELGNVSPNSFMLTKQGQIILRCGVDNRNLASDQLKRQIEFMCMNYVDFENLWNPTRWGTGISGVR